MWDKKQYIVSDFFFWGGGGGGGGGERALGAFGLGILSAFSNKLENLVE